MLRRILQKFGIRSSLETRADKMPTDNLMDLLVAMISRRANALPPPAAMKFLLELDSALYPLHGAKSVEYGEGLHTKHHHTRYHDFFVDRVSETDTVLDIGCGNGALSFDIAEGAGANITAIDSNEDNITLAIDQYAHPKIRYLCGDLVSDLPNEHFNVVVMSNVLEHLADRPHILREICDAVTPRKILVRVPVFERDWRVPLKKELGVEWRLDPTHETEYTLESFAEEMAATGLEIRHQEVRWGEIWAELAPIQSA